MIPASYQEILVILFIVLLHRSEYYFQPQQSHFLTILLQSCKNLDSILLESFILVLSE